MAQHNDFLGYDNVYMVLEPKDLGSTITASAYVDIKYANRVAFLACVGAITTATAANNEIITVEAATAETGTEVAISFNYRKAGISTGNTWGAVTTAATTGVTFASTDDNQMIWIELDPSAVFAEKEDARYVRVKWTDDDDMTAFLTSVVAFVDSRYKQTTHKSVTAAATA